MRAIVGLSFLAVFALFGPARSAETDLFPAVATILERHCLSCHDAKKTKGGLSLISLQAALAGGDSGPALVPGKSVESLLLSQIVGIKPRMPRGGKPLTPAQVQIVNKWIEAGAPWPKSRILEDHAEAKELWWSLRPVQRPALPVLKDSSQVRTPIDVFLLQKLQAQGLSFNPEADRRTLLRRLTFDLHGLPPTPEEIEAFLRDNDPHAYDKVVDRLLASPRHGERWARHWLDVVHYGDTHGYDKDKLRPNAWPYRDYVIRAFNEDKHYSRFIEEQVAGDVLHPGTRDGIVGLGFLAAGPWDFVGHVELREGSLDKAITRNLDRDDMVATTMNTFTGLTVQCARCHDHKFDPIAQEDYYSLQAVFAAIDRADRSFDADPTTVQRRKELQDLEAGLNRRRGTLNEVIHKQAGQDLAALEEQIEKLSKIDPGIPRAEFGYHSQLSLRQDVEKWVQVDLGKRLPIGTIVYVGCHDTFNNIGPGFGFPVRYKIEIADDPDFKDARVVEDRTKVDVPNPGIRPQSIKVNGQQARFVRFTATKLAPRMNDYILALAEMIVLTPEGTNGAAGVPVRAMDSIEAPPRWRASNLVDGYYFGIGKPEVFHDLTTLQARRKDLLDRSLDAAARRELAAIERLQIDLNGRRAALPPEALVYAATTTVKPGSGIAATNGKPRPIHLLKRGSEKQPGKLVGPGTVACIAGLESRFPAPEGQPEGQRRAALARWLTDPRNPLTWRSIVNRVWHYHFGQGIVDTPNDFGRMGGAPSHPELLDYLASDFRDNGQSLKALHRLIVTSAAYRQSSAFRPDVAQADAGNRLLGRMNRRKLEAEALRDAVLHVSGKLDGRQFGPGFKPFGFLDDHSPHYKYEEHDPDAPDSQRRSVYRFLVRSVPEPFMETLDCADPSLLVERRNETLTALQALALLNNRFMVRMAEHFAHRVESLAPDLPGRVAAAHRLALGRVPEPAEARLLTDLAAKHGLANACRLLFNANEFCFVD